MSEQPRNERDWHEDIGPVLWWLWPIEEPPYVGTPLDLGFVVEGEMQIGGSDGSYGAGKVRMNVGGWPFGDEQDERRSRLWWTPLPDESDLDRLIRDKIRGYAEEPSHVE